MRPTKERLEEIRASWWKFPTQMWVGDLFNGIDALEKERDELKARKCSHGPYEMYGTDGCEKCDYGRIEMYRLNRLCLECQHKDDVQAAPRCKHDIHGNDCVKCYPSEVK